MEERPVEELIDRIDSALARIERACTRSDANLRDLSGRHEKLKASVADALRDVDALIARASE